MDILQNASVFPPVHVDERRSASRFQLLPDSEFADVDLPGGRPQSVEVHDESLGGLGLIFPAEFHVLPGMEFHVTYTANQFRAQVRHLRRLVDGRQLAGLACERLLEIYP